LRVLVVGSGAVGGFYGAKLARSDNSVCFLARGENLRALRTRGLRVEGPAGDLSVAPVEARESARGAGPFDLALVCVKAQDSEGAIAGLGDELAPGAIVLSLQNGVESEETIERALGLPPILRGLAYVGTELTAPGVIRHTSGGTAVLGEADDRRSPRLERLLGLFHAAGIDTQVPESMTRAKWQKLAWNASFNMVSALTGAELGRVLDHAPARALVEASMGETEQVAASLGIAFEKDYIARVTRLAERAHRAVRPSTLQDREKGKPLEHAALSGAVVRFGERAGVPTPVNRTLDALASLVTQRR
jgi:2-dehydropantoate 2-reductase